MGVVVTTTAEEPPLHSVRTVNRGFLVPSKKKIHRLWDSSGLGGKKGSIWTVNQLEVSATHIHSYSSPLQLATVVEGFEPPAGEFLDMKANRFIAGDAFRLSSEEQQHQQLPKSPSLTTTNSSEEVNKSAPPLPPKQHQRKPSATAPPAVNPAPSGKDASFIRKPPELPPKHSVPATPEIKNPNDESLI